MVSCTPDKALQCGHAKCSPGTCSMRNSKRLGSPSNRHSATRHCLPSPSAAVKSSSGVILLTAVQPNQKRKSLIGSRTRCKSFCVLRARSEERSEEHTSELQSRPHLVCRLLLEKKKK